jgi:phosphoribosylformylglycinamidine (FGAM) synthase PurS component
MAIKKEISLLPEAENPNSFSTRLFKWLTTVGRWVIVLTELIVVGAFLSRFWLDRKNADLSETVRQDQSILESTKDFEAEFNSLQERLKSIRNFYANEPQYNQQIDILVNSTPKDLIYNNISVTHDTKLNQIKADASLMAFKENSIISFISNLMLNPNIESVNINQIEKKDKENNYSIDISVVFKNSPSKT